jgi:hypothetical protein
MEAVLERLHSKAVLFTQLTLTMTLPIECLVKKYYITNIRKFL